MACPPLHGVGANTRGGHGFAAVLDRVKQRKLFRKSEGTTTNWPDSDANLIDGYLHFLALDEMCRASHRREIP
ncbi:hypothetical protein [Cupriavidus necator]|uniref:hypothetical protein n=1 Tax=Cupriavidus necator TaxID=106590 RepID=UPI0009C26015|nr:hypothetical protein [Cupriavidus necator]